MGENQIVVHQPNETVRLDVYLENKTVWLTQAKLGTLFGVDRSVVNRHIHNIFKTYELVETAICAEIAQVQNESGRSITRIVSFYNLDMIIGDTRADSSVYVKLTEKSDGEVVKWEAIA